jgi:hypothetical protein
MKRFFYGASIGACFGLLFATAHAALPLSWQVSNPPPTNSRLNAVTYGNGRFMAVGVERTIIRSPDGVNWELSLNAPGAMFWSATFGNGIFVIGGEPRSLLGSSADDGLNWNASQSTTGIEGVYGLAFGKGLFVGVGQGSSSSSPYIVTSPNGNTWQSQSAPITRVLHAIGYGNNLFVAVGEAGTIITSLDGTNWTSRISGTSVMLRAVTFNGSRFIVGGDSGTTLSSIDGISWSPAPPASFDIHALASGGGAVVAVGNYQGAGRAQGSPDGLSWPGNPAQFNDSLRGVTYRTDYFVVVGDNGLILRSSGAPGGGTNSWTKPTSGNWEEPYWSLGELPSISQPGVAFTNSGFKALAIGYATTVNYPSSLNVRNLLVDAPEDSSNLLLLNYAGLDIPLRVTHDFKIGAHGALLSYASSLVASNLYVDGRATFAEYGQTETLTLTMGKSAPAELTLSNGWFKSLQQTVSVSAPAVFRQFGGTNLSVGLEVQTAGTYDLRGGTLLSSYPGVHIGGGAFLNQGGSLQSWNVFVENGTFTQTAGSAEVSVFALAAPDGSAGSANATVSGGILGANFLDLGRINTTGFHGNFSQSGGVVTNRALTVKEGSRYSLSGGVLLVREGVLVAGRFEQNGGSNTIGNLNLVGDGVYAGTAGFLSTGGLQLGGHSQFHRGNVTLRNENDTYPGVHFYGSGSFFAGSGAIQLGRLLVVAEAFDDESVLDLETGGPSVVSFQDSHEITWYRGTLIITNWAGSRNGGGADRIYVGTNNSSLTAEQLAAIRFANPPGLPAGEYPARILATGEVVPEGRPLLVSSQTPNGFQLRWNTNRCQLLSSTNVAGPYQPLNPQPTSPYTLMFGDPQRFFVLQCQ